MTRQALDISNEQVGALPLLLGIIADLGIRDLIDAQISPHGGGASIGSIVSAWICHLVLARDRQPGALGGWVARQSPTLSAMLESPPHPSDYTEERLDAILTILGDHGIQAALDTAMLRHWALSHHLPAQTVRLGHMSIGVAQTPGGLLERHPDRPGPGHRPDLHRLKLLLATLDPLGLPLCCRPMLRGADSDELYLPAYGAAMRALGKPDVLVIGDRKLSTLPVRGHIAAQGGYYLCAHNPTSDPGQLAAWVDLALTRPNTWRLQESLDAQTLAVQLDAVIVAWKRAQTWSDPTTMQSHSWAERVLLVRVTAQQARLRRLRERALTRLTAELHRLSQVLPTSRKLYRQEADLAQAVASRIGGARLEGVVQTSLRAVTLPDATSAWYVEAVWVNLSAWQAMVERLGWQVYLSNTSTTQHAVRTLVTLYRQHAAHDRGLGRLKAHTLWLRPDGRRDEARLAGLIWLLCLALRVLSLTEHRLHAAVLARGESLAALHPHGRARTAAMPSAEQVIAAFRNIKLTVLRGDGWQQHHVSPLSRTQRYIIDVLGMPHDLYTRLERRE